MQNCFIEMLENRRLLSTSVWPHAPQGGAVVTPERTEIKASLNRGQLLAILRELNVHPVLTGFFQEPVSDGQVLSEPARFLLEYLRATGPKRQSVARPATKGAVVSTTFRLQIVDPSFLFDQFGTVYKFTLSATNPLSLFSFKRKDAQGDTMLFTGTLSKNLKTITGVFKTHGPNTNLADTYSVTLAKK